MWAERMQHAMTVRRSASPEQFFDLHFRELLADPFSAVERTYAHFGFELSEEAEIRMRHWIADNPQGKHGGHQYSAEEFGLSEDEISERFAPYLEHFQVARETTG
jgi:hypothetical protein